LKNTESNQTAQNLYTSPIRKMHPIRTRIANSARLESAESEFLP
jgi:hypothetical protein